MRTPRPNLIAGKATYEAEEDSKRERFCQDHNPPGRVTGERERTSPDPFCAGQMEMKKEEMTMKYSIVVYDGKDGVSELLRERFFSFAECEERYFELCEEVQLRQVENDGEEIDNPLYGGYVAIERRK